MHKLEKKSIQDGEYNASVDIFIIISISFETILLCLFCIKCSFELLCDLSTVPNPAEISLYEKKVQAMINF